MNPYLIVLSYTLYTFRPFISCDNQSGVAAWGRRLVDLMNSHSDCMSNPMY